MRVNSIQFRSFAMTAGLAGLLLAAGGASASAQGAVRRVDWL